MTPLVRPVGIKQLNVPITAPVLGSVRGRQFTSISPSVTSWKMQRLLLFVPRLESHEGPSPNKFCTKFRV